jgi:hypothetical protein
MSAIARRAPPRGALARTIGPAVGGAFLVAALAACACLPAGAAGAPAVSLHAAFHPEHPGRTTTVSLGIRIAPGAGEIVPPPLAEANLRFPAGLAITLSGLGIDTCSAATLESAGPTACPANSWMGEGKVVAELPIHHEPFREDAQVAIVRGPEVDEHLVMLFDVYDETAVNTEIILSGQLLPESGPFDGRLAIEMPLVQTFPGAPDLAVSELSFVLGPPELTYYERVHDKIVPYTPNGIRLPEHCPRDGYPFAIELGFPGGAQAAASTAVPCPKREGRHR